MANSKHYATVVELGERLVQELGLDDSNDTLGRWMAHYIAEQISKAASANGATRRALQQECFHSILELWKHRSTLPAGRRPLREWEALFDTLSTLDLRNFTPRYFQTARAAAEQEGVGAESKKWLEAATSLDYAARVLIRYCLAAAAENSVEGAGKWIRLVEKLDRQDDFDVRIVHYVADDLKTLKQPTESDLRRQAVDDMIRRLDMFAGAVKILSSQLRRQRRQAVVVSEGKQSKSKSTSTKTTRHGRRRTRSQKERVRR
jgi:hypothetical protein